MTIDNALNLQGLEVVQVAVQTLKSEARNTAPDAYCPHVSVYSKCSPAPEAFRLLELLSSRSLQRVNHRYCRPAGAGAITRDLARRKACHRLPEPSHMQITRLVDSCWHHP